MKRLIVVWLAIVVLLAVCGLYGGSAMAQSLDGSIAGVLKKSGLKILHIGNSFTADATAYLPDIVKKTGADVSDMCIYRTMLSGASFKAWYDTYNDDYPWMGYKVIKVLGGLDAGIATGDGEAGDGSLFRQALSGTQWDIVFIQQGPSSAPYYEEWADGGCLNELLAVIRKHQPQAVIGLVLQHSYASNYEGNKEQSSLKRWQLIAQSVMQCCRDYGISLVLPYGTAVQNLRASSLNNDMDLTCDGAHCEVVLTRYTASCCYYQTIIAPRTGIPVTADRTILDASWYNVTSPIISVNFITRPIAQRAAMLAMEDMYHCTNPETDITLGIDATLNDKGEMINEKCFDLQGRQLSDSKWSNSPIQKGVYIKDGRKYVK